MKKIIFFIFSIIFLTGCSATSEKNDVEANASASMKIRGMTCAEMCAKRIEDKINRMVGVKSCEVDFEKEIATFKFDTKKVDLDNLVSTIEDMSDNQYKVSEIKTKSIKNINSEMNSEGGNKTGQIMTSPSFELPNIADYFRNII